MKLRMRFNNKIQYLKWKIDDEDTKGKVKLEILNFFQRLLACVHHNEGDIFKLIQEMEELSKDAR